VSSSSSSSSSSSTNTQTRVQDGQGVGDRRSPVKQLPARHGFTLGRLRAHPDLGVGHRGRAGGWRAGGRAGERAKGREGERAGGRLSPDGDPKPWTLYREVMVDQALQIRPEQAVSVQQPSVLLRAHACACARARVRVRVCVHACGRHCHLTPASSCVRVCAHAGYAFTDWVVCVHGMCAPVPCSRTMCKQTASAHT